MDKNNSLSQKAVRAGVWVFAFRIAGRIFDIVRIIILARILMPRDFGLIGIALLAIAILETFSRTGFQEALIQKKSNIESYLDAAWTVSILRGFILFAILYLFAPYVALFFKSPGAEILIRVMGISILFQALHNIGVIYFQKELEFNKQFIYQLSGTLADFIVAISCALILKNVWALVFGLLARDFVRCIVSYIIHPYRPIFRLNLEKTKELFGFGKWILGSSILIFLITHGDDAFVGKFLGITMLGFYQLAYRISNMPATEITHVISKVSFPAYSKLQENIAKLREAYLKVLQTTTFLSFPVAGLICVLAPDFTRLFLGEKWMPMVPAMQVLVLWGLIRSIGATTGPIFYAVGKPKIATKLQFVQSILLVITIYPLTVKWGILGTSLSVVFAALLPNLMAFYETIKITRCSIPSFCKQIWIPLMNTLIGVLFVLVLKENLIAVKNVLTLVAYITTILLIYLGLTYMLSKLLNYKIWSVLDKLRKDWKVE